MKDAKNDHSINNLIADCISVFTIILASFLFLWMLTTANRGLDYSDDAYSYFWARYPFEYRFAIRLSGFFLHPIDLLVNHSLAGLRMVGMFLTAAIGVLIGIVTANRVSGISARLAKADFIAACALAIFIGCIHWLNTPSYQLMTVWGLGLLLAGFTILARRPPSSIAAQLCTASLISGGGLILAFAKIPTAMVAGALTIGLVLCAYDQSKVARWHLLGLIVLVEALLFAVTAALLSPSYIVELLREGVSLRSGYGGLFDLLLKHLADFRNMPPKFVVIIAISATSILTTLVPSAYLCAFRVAPSTIALTLGAIAICGALAFSNPVQPILDRYDVYNHGIQMTVLAFAALTLATAVYRYRKQAIRRETVVLVMLMILAPWVASLGTGNNFLAHTAAYSGFSGLAIIVANLEMPNLVARATRLFVVLMSGAILYVAAQHPYRLNRPVPDQNVPAKLDGLNGGIVLVDAPTASFFSNLHDGARAGGLSAGMPLFDLAGFGPGFNLALGTKPPVYPWIAAGYPNSPAILDKIWSLTPQADRERAWVIGPIHESFQGATALNFLMPLDLNYELVLRIAEPQTGMNIELWRPRNTIVHGKL